MQSIAMDPAEPVQTSLRRPRKQEGAHQFYMKQARYEMAHEVAEMKTGWRRSRMIADPGKIADEIRR